MINVMIARGWYDRDLVAEWTTGFDALAERAARYSPGRVAQITWVPADDIRRAAQTFATIRDIVRPGRRTLRLDAGRARDRRSYCAGTVYIVR